MTSEHDPLPLDNRSLNQSAAELLACAICELFPGAQLIESKVTDFGFHYDVVLKKSLDENAFPIIEEQMHALARKSIPVRTLEMMRENAISYFQHHGQEIKAELLRSYPSNIVSVFKMGNFIDLCPDGYMQNSEEVATFKLLSIKPLISFVDGLDKMPATRIEGVARPDAYHLKKFIKKWENAKKRDHLILGQEMGLFDYSMDPLFCLWKPQGILLRRLLHTLPQMAYPHKFQELDPIPLIPSALMQPKYRQDYFLEAESGIDSYFACPNPAFLPVYATTLPLQTEQNLPIRYRTLGTIWEPTLPQHCCGLFAHPTPYCDVIQTFCQAEQLESEVISHLQFINKIIKIFDFKSRWVIHSNHPRYLKHKRDWDRAEETLVNAIKKCDFQYDLDKDESTPYGLSYGPKIEMRLEDALGRQWPGPFIAIDVFHPDCLNLRYYDLDGSEKKLMMLTHSVFGSLDRFVALLIEHYSGDLPFWLAPEQVRIIPIGQKQEKWANSVGEALTANGIRFHMDMHPHPLGEKVHKAEIEKIPYSVILGDQEEKRKVITVRSRGKGEIKKNLTLDGFIEWLKMSDKT